MNSFIKLASALIAAMVYLSLVGCSASNQGNSSAVDNPPTGSGGSGNSTPTISGIPPFAVLYGESYSFLPVVSDPDGDDLSFEIQNKPTWADFNAGTGRMSGIPTFADTGLYSNISITVSDAQASASTPQFSVEVTQTQLGSATLTWNAPVQNSDGSTLTDLSAIKIYFGNTQGYYPNQVLIENPSITTYVVEYLASRTYYFVATALNGQGTESLVSDAVQFSVN